MNILKICVVLLVASLLYGCQGSPSIDSEAFTVASFNLNTYGATKASNSEIVEVMAQIIRRYDIVAVQEIADVTETHIDTLLTEVNSDGSAYGLITSERLGRTVVKHQYGFFYDTARITYSGNSTTYDDVGDSFEREPYAAKFAIKGKDLDFSVTVVHVKPDDADAEIALLPDVLDAMVAELGESDAVCVGTFNADGAYYDEVNLPTVFPSPAYSLIIDDTLDTTESGFDLTYDRIVATKALSLAEPQNAGVYAFNTQIDFGPLTIVSGDVSDHLPVFAELVVETDID